MRVLICDDNEDAARTLSMLVGMDRHETKVCMEGAACIATARAWRPHIGLIDIGMPEIDGYEVARAIRKELGNEVLLIAVTGFSGPEDVKAAKRAGFDLHFAKANDPDALLQIVRGGARPSPATQ